MAQDKVSVEITVEERQALKALKKLAKGVDKFGDDSKKSLKKTDLALASFAGNLAATAASSALFAIGSGLKSLAVGSFEAAAATEKIRTQLEVLTGSQEKAATLYKELTDFSASTPFQLQGISEAAAQLVAFGFEAETVTARVEKIGEVAAGSGAHLKDVALIYGQVAAAGKLTGERLLQLQERAIPIGAALAKTLNVAETEVKSLVSSGVVGFAEFESAFNSMSQEGGLFQGAIQKQSETINGVISTLKDNFFLLEGAIGDAFAPAIIDGAKILTVLLQDMAGYLRETEADAKFAAGGVDVLRKTVVTLEGRLKGIQENQFNLPEMLLGDEAEISEKLAIYKSKLAEVTASDRTFVEQKMKTVNIMDELNAALFGREDFVSISESPRVDKEKVTSQKILEQRAAFAAQLAVLEEDKQIKEQETILANTDLESEQRADALGKLHVFENAKADAILNAELEKNKKIKDITARGLADKAAFAKNAIAIEQNSAKINKVTREQENKDREVFFQKAISLSSSSSKELAAIGKLAGLAQIAIATPPAIASSFNFGTATGGPVLGGIFAGIAAAAQAQQAAKLAGMSFATGGVVGGFNGATSGSDNTTANVRTGEMFLNASQQRTLFEIANNSGAENNNGQMIEITSIVQVDEREIARSVRNQRLEGFKI